MVSLFLLACGADKSTVTELATKLSNEGGVTHLTQQDRAGYIECGVTTLSDLPLETIQAALKAPDAPAIWTILGSDALDKYVAVCRKLDWKRGRPPKY